ncbi:MAG: hypothetical protein JJU00_09070 [Opitutales bacterium]|nr:hypothetical protein [Opitutales bacterium]
MKHTFWLIGPVAVAALAAGCKPADRSESDTQSSVSRQIEQVQTDTRDAAKELDAFTHAQKEAFIENLETRLARLDENINELSAKLATSSREVRAEAQPRIAALRAQSAHLHTQLDKVKDAGESNWESVKRGTSEAYTELRVGFNNTREWLSEKISP